MKELLEREVSAAYLMTYERRCMRHQQLPNRPASGISARIFSNLTMLLVISLLYQSHAHGCRRRRPTPVSLAAAYTLDLG
jgi:hypothetical protein